MNHPNHKFKIYLSIIIGITFLAAVFQGCGKDEETKTTPSGTTGMTFTGITETDDVGAYYGNIDSSDWLLSETWGQSIENLFDQVNTGATANFIPPTYTTSAHPNPANGNMSFSFDVGTGNFVDFRLVDTQLNVKIGADSITQNFVISNSAGLSLNTIYRVYYKIYGNGAIYRGHGDVKFVP